MPSLDKIRGHRGQMTPLIEKEAKEYLGEDAEFTWVHLRLLPYMQYLAINKERINSQKVNEKEWEILQEWGKLRYIKLDKGVIWICHGFWSFMNRILWYAYIDCK